MDGSVEAHDIRINVKPREINYMASNVQQVVESHEKFRMANDLINWKVQYASIVKNQKKLGAPPLPNITYVNDQGSNLNTLVTKLSLHGYLWPLTTCE